MNLRFTCLALSISLSTWIQAGDLTLTVLPAPDDFHVIRHIEGDPFESQEWRLSVADIHPNEIKSLGDGLIYDLKSIAESAGLTIQKNERFLYSPRTRLLFCHARQETIDHMAALIEPVNRGVMAYEISLWSDVFLHGEGEGVTQADSRRLFLRGISRSGAKWVVNMEEDQEISVEFTIGLEEIYDTRLNANFKLGESDVRISSQFVGEIGHDITVLERPTASDSNKFDRLILRIDPKPTEYQRRFDKEWQRETARKIAAEIGIPVE
jgi:hypothetical protein